MTDVEAFEDDVEVALDSLSREISDIGRVRRLLWQLVSSAATTTTAAAAAAIVASAAAAAAAIATATAA